MAARADVHGARQVERSAVSAFVPVLAMLPFTLLALLVIWLPLAWVSDVRYWVFALVFLAGGFLMFVKPVQAAVLTPLLGARRPTTAEADARTSCAEVGQARAAVRLARQVAVALDEVGLSPAQYRVLAFLDEGQAAASAVAGRLSITRPSATTLIDGLEAVTSQGC